jgi:hypothetical protein
MIGIIIAAIPRDVLMFGYGAKGEFEWKVH